MEQKIEYTQYLKIQDEGMDDDNNYVTFVDLEPIHLSRANLVHGGHG